MNEPLILEVPLSYTNGKYDPALSRSIVAAKLPGLTEQVAALITAKVAAGMDEAAAQDAKGVKVIIKVPKVEVMA